VAAGGDGVTAVHVDGGLRAILSGAVLTGAATPVGKSAHAVQFVCQFVCQSACQHDNIRTIERRMMKLGG